MSGDGVDIGGGTGGAVAESGVARSRELIRGLIDRPGYAFSDAEVLANTRALYELSAVVEAAKLAFVAELGTRPEAVPGARAGRVAATFLTEALLVSGPQANRDVAAAAALASASPELPRMAQALIDGQVSRDHVDVAVSTLNRLPKALKKKIITEPTTEPAAEPAVIDPADPADPVPSVCRTGADVIDEVLTTQARVLPPSTVERLGRQIVARLDPDRAERFTADAFERRSCSYGTDFAGMGVYKVILDAATHLQVRALIARCSAPRPPGEAVTDAGEVITVKDTRTATQRQADAVADLILAGGLALGVDHPTVEDQAAHEAADDETPDASSGGDDVHAADCDGSGDSDDVSGREDVADQQDTGAPEGIEKPRSRRSECTERTERVGGLPVGVFMARPVVAAEISVVTTVPELMAAFRAGDPTAPAAGLAGPAGLARVTLAGSVGSYPGATVDPRLLGRLACDSPLYRFLVDDNGAILHHGRRRRFASNSQRRALAVRDGGCVIPGCHAPPEWCEAHHLIPWTQGGCTDIDAMALLCARHHSAHHAGVYVLEMRDGIPWVRLPGWQDATQPWLRNHTHHHDHLADTTARTITGPPPVLSRATDGATDHAAA